MAVGIDARLARGAAAFNAGRFFRAHEIWEEEWLEAVGPDKQLLQGLVQVAAGYAKCESGLRRGALKLLTAGCDKLRQFPPASGGVDLYTFVDGVAADIQSLRAAPDATVSRATVCPPLLQAA